MFRGYDMCSPVSAEEPTGILVRLYSNTCVYDWYQMRLCNVVQYIATDRLSTQLRMMSQSSAARYAVEWCNIRTDGVNNEPSVGGMLL